MSTFVPPRTLSTCSLSFARLLGLFFLIITCSSLTLSTAVGQQVDQGPSATADPLTLFERYVAKQTSPVSAYDLAATFDPSYGAESVFNGASTWNISVTALDATTFVVAYRDEGNSEHGTAIVGTVTDTAISYGAETVFNAAITDNISVAALDATTFVVGYHDYANSDQGTAIVGSSPCDPLVITNTTDSGCGSLREAIHAANHDLDLSSITFNIPGTGPHTIRPNVSLPEITSPVIIDGSTQPGNAGVCSNPISSRPPYAIILDGANSFNDGLVFENGSDGSTIRGLNVRRFSEGGLVIWSSNNTIACNFVGTDEDGNSEMGNNFGVVVIGSSNEIGGPSADDGNLISGSTLHGLSLTSTGTGATNNTVLSNQIGTDASGTSALGNLVGISILNASSNEIGSTATGTGNLISGNSQQGMFISSGAIGNQVIGNKIGTDINGTASLGNLRGIHIVGSATGNNIGGAAMGAGNLISGNTFQGIHISSIGSNQVLGNYIGTDISGTADLGNGSDGVYIDGSSSNSIGSMADGARNLISGNDMNGINISGSSAEGNVIRGNYIGTDFSGTLDLGNTENGVFIHNDATMNTIGGTSMDEGNIIAFNNGGGVVIEGNASLQNAILSNSTYGNTTLAIDLADDGVTPNDVDDTDSGSNNLQNYPSLTDAIINSSGELIVSYSVDTDPTNATYPLNAEFFRADVDDQEGEVFLGRGTYSTTNHSGCGISPCEATVNLGNVVTLGISTGDAVLSIVTDDEGNTSEFSGTVLVVTPSVTRYVATTGNDTGNDCTDPINPCATLTHAANEANPGDVINMAAGTYDGLGLIIENALFIEGDGVIIE